MSYADATAFAASLATTLMVSIVVFQAGDGTHAACPAAEFDGDDEAWAQMLAGCDEDHEHNEHCGHSHK